MEKIGNHFLGEYVKVFADADILFEGTIVDITKKGFMVVIKKSSKSSYYEFKDSITFVPFNTIIVLVDKEKQ